MVHTRSTNYSPMVNQTLTERTKSNGNGKRVTEARKTVKDSSVGDRTVYIVFFSLLLDLLAFTLILPLFPSLLEYYDRNDRGGFYGWLSDTVKIYQQKIGAPETSNPVLFAGALGSMYSFLQFVASPIVGSVSDVYGRRPVMIACLIGISASYVLWALSYNFELFVLARFVGGLSKGNVNLTMAVISDVTDNKNRGKAMALVGIAFSLGFIFGPPIGAWFSLMTDKSNVNWYMYPALFALMLSLSDLLFVTVFLKESLPKEKRAKGIFLSLSRALSFISISHLFQFKVVQKLSAKDLSKLQKLGLVYFIYLFIYSGLEFTLTFLTYHTFEYTSMQQGKMFFVVGLIMAIIQGSVVRRLPEKATWSGAMFGLCIIPFSFLSISLVANKNDNYFNFISPLHLLYLGLVLFAISTAFVVSCLTTMVSQIGTPDQRGTTLGVFRSLGALARAFGPIIASFLYWSIGSFLTYGSGALLLVIPILMLRHL